MGIDDNAFLRPVRPLQLLESLLHETQKSAFHCRSFSKLGKEPLIIINVLKAVKEVGIILEASA